MEDLQVSVVIPSYNSEKTIRQAVESALSQEGVTLEVIVVDDGSRIPASEVLSDLLADTRLRILRREENLGVAAARNHGIINAAGKYVALLDSDDWWEQGKLAEQVEALERNKAVLCSTARELMSHDGVSLGRIISVRKHITYKELLKHNSIACSSVVVRRDVARIFPMEHDDAHEDYILWLKILKRYGSAIGIQTPYLKYRMSENSKSGNKLKSAVMTYKVYRYMGYSVLRSAVYFCSYAVHGINKYAGVGKSGRRFGRRQKKKEA